MRVEVRCVSLLSLSLSLSKLGVGGLDVGDGFVRFAAGTDGMVRGRGKERVRMSLKTGKSDAVQYAILAPPQHTTLRSRPRPQSGPVPGHSFRMRDICRDLVAVGGNIGGCWQHLRKHTPTGLRVLD